MFQIVKYTIVEQTKLKYYDSGKEVTISVDASENRLGAIL